MLLHCPPSLSICTFENYSLMKKLFIAVAFCVPLTCAAQDDKISDYARPGDFQLGMRTTVSLFGHENSPGFGVGGQWRIQPLKVMNTEWFADWITIDLNGAGTRYNGHIGWSVMFYPKKLNRFIPYIMAGHCFDYAKIVPLSTQYLDRSDEIIERWSSAVQMGLGAHYYLNDRFNLSLAAQYMLHLSKHLDYELTDTGNGFYLETQNVTPGEAGLEGHFLITTSLNYRLFCTSKKYRRTKS